MCEHKALATASPTPPKYVSDFDKQNSNPFTLSQPHHTSLPAAIYRRVPEPIFQLKNTIAKNTDTPVLHQNITKII